MLKKPKYCGENWLEMEPTEDGRICGSCQKTIVDFSNKSWKEIEAIQSAAEQPLCGMYSKKQLKYWGQEPPKTIPGCKSWLLASALLTVNLPLLEQLNAQPTEAVEQVKESASISDTTRSQIVKGLVYDADNEEPLFAANVVINNTEIGVVTDIDGKFELEIPKEHWQDSLMISYIGYEDKMIPIASFSEHSLTTHQLLRATMTPLTEEHITYFYIKTPSKRKRFWQRVKNFFRRK